MPTRLWWGSLLERNQLEFIGIDGRITLKWIIKKQAGMAPAGVIWLQVGDK